MGDVFTPQKRSEIMARVKSRGNRTTEMRLITIFRDYKITGWRRRAPMFGHPDFVFRRVRIAVFVDGCFWHGCPIHGSIPETNRAFWAAKLERNVNRDRAVAERLQSRGWGVLRVWQHDLGDAAAVAHRVTTAIADSSIMPYRPASEAVAAASSPYARLIFPDSNIAVLSELRV